jgi:hypothetical protein
MVGLETVSIFLTLQWATCRRTAEIRKITVSGHLNELLPLEVLPVQEPEGPLK